MLTLPHSTYSPRTVASLPPSPDPALDPNPTPPPPCSAPSVRRACTPSATPPPLWSCAAAAAAAGPPPRRAQPTEPSAAPASPSAATARHRGHRPPRAPSSCLGAAPGATPSSPSSPTSTDWSRVIKDRAHRPLLPHHRPLLLGVDPRCPDHPRPRRLLPQLRGERLHRFPRFSPCLVAVCAAHHFPAGSCSPRRPPLVVDSLMSLPETEYKVSLKVSLLI